VRRFLKHWRPSLVLWVESELWPTMLTAVEERHIPAVLVNARMSERSFRGWHRFRSLARRVLSPFVLVLAQTPDVAERLKQLGAKRVQTTGNLKLASEPLPFDANRLEALRDEIGPRAVWVAASTHDPEEMTIAEAHRALKADLPALLTLIVPRHRERGDAIAARLRGDGFAVAQRSREEPIAPETDIYLADTMGELGLFYRLSAFAFVGGSLIPHGGQNPLEPARLGLGVLHGPNVSNFTKEYAELGEACGAQEVDGADALAAAARALFADGDQARVMGNDARRVADAGGETFKRVTARIDPFIRRLPFDAAS
jgi:3-deoxy-D-manno-octulosonic-acid transferase